MHKSLYPVLLGISANLSAATSALPLNPAGEIGVMPTHYEWQADPNAVWYAVVVRDSSGQLPIYAGLSPQEAGCAGGSGQCALTTTTPVASGAGEWWVRTWLPDSDENWSTGQTFNFTGESAPAPSMPTETSAQPLLPAGTLAVSPTQYTWQADPNAVWYAVVVRDGSGQYPVNLSLSPEEAGCADGTGQCSASTTQPISDGAGEWWIRAWMPNQEAFWSSGAAFTLSSAPAGAPPALADCPAGALRWSDPASWPNGHVPADDEAVTIPAGMHIGLDSATAQLGGLTVAGTLSFCQSDVALSADWILLEGELRAGSEEAPFTHRAVITLSGDDPDESIAGMGTRGIMVLGGALELHGNAPDVSWSKINQHANAGDTYLMLSEPLNWALNDEIVLAPTDYYGVAETESFRITAINATELSLDHPLEHFRWGLMQYVTAAGMSLTPDAALLPPAPADAGATPLQLDERAEIGNLSRNIVIQGADDSLWQNQGFGAHVMIMTLDAAVHVDGVEFRRVGQAGRLGRYPFHWHRLSYDNAGNELGDASGHYLRNSAIHGSQNRCVTLHGTNGVSVQNNICYDILGHAVYFEDAVERRNTVEDNLVLRVRFPAAERALKLHDLNVQPGFDSGASGIWVSNPDNTVRHNTLADAQGFGLWMAFPANPVGPSANVPIHPYRLQFGNFDDNTMHSNQSRGVMLDNVESDDAGHLTALQYASTTDGQAFAWPYETLQRFTIRGWKLWKNTGNGNFWNRVVWPTYEEFVSADSHGKFFSGSGAEGLITRALLVGSSLNDAFPSPQAWMGPAAALATYHSAYDMRDNIIVNFPLVAGHTSGAFATDDYYLRPVEKGPVRNANNLLINSHPGYRSNAAVNEGVGNFAQGFTHYVFAGALWDPHGIWGPANQWNVYDRPFFTHGANCSVIAPASQNAASCDGEYFGVNDFVLDQSNEPWNDLMAISVSRLDDATGSETVDTWHVDTAQPGALLAHMRHFAARRNGSYLLDFPESPVPSDVSVEISNMHAPSDAFVLGIRFSGGEDAQVYSSTFYNYMDEVHANSPTWAIKHNYSEVASRQDVIDSAGETYWQDHAENIVWVKVALSDLQRYSDGEAGPFSDETLYNAFHLRVW